MAARKLVCVDLSNYENRKADIAASLLSAATEEGFFFVTGHGVSDAELQRMYALSRAFFTLPEDVKSRTRGPMSNPHYVLGYFSEELELGPVRQGFLCAHDNSRMAGLWPADPPTFKQEALAFMRQLHGVVSKLMTCLALALGLPEDAFLKEMCIEDDDNGSALSFNYFPSVEGKEVKPGQLRISQHTDFEILTLLFQSQPGLEICPGKDSGGVVGVQTNALDEKWTPAGPLPGAITCNIGDALQYLTDGKLRSTYHRVRLPQPGEYQGERISLAYFSNVKLTTPLQGPLKKYPPVNFLDLLASRAAAIPLAMEADGTVKAAAMDRYHSYVAGPDVPAVQ